MKSRYLVCQGREIHFNEWGEETAPPIIAWHGLARTARDMDDIAAHLGRRWRVICASWCASG